MQNVVSFSTLAEIRAASTGTSPVIFQQSIWAWTAGDFTGRVDDVNVIKSDANAVTVGAWLRMADTRISHTSSIADARIRSVFDKLDETVSVLDFGADPTGATDSTDAFNRALSAAMPTTGNDDAPKRKVTVPRGHYKIGAGNKTVFVRKGQHLAGEGLGCFIDCRDAIDNTKPLIRLGAGSLYENADGGDPNGLGSQISGFWFLGGPGGAPIVDTSQQAGWWIDHCFFTASGIGVLASGGDGLLHGCQFDLGLNGVVLKEAGNVTVYGCNFYNNNYAVRVLDQCRDVEINGCHFEYQHYSSIFIGSGTSAALNSRGIVVRGNTFLQNTQWETFVGFVSLGCSDGEVDILGGNTFRNCYGPAIRETIGVGNKVTIIDAIFDGRRTFTHPVYGYDQSTTMSAVDASNMDVVIKSSVFRRLPGQPIVFGGTVTTKLALADCRFEENSGGSSEIGITNAVTGSRIDLSNIQGGGRLLFNPQAAVPVHCLGLKDWLDAPATSGSRRFVKVPVQQSQVVSISMKANTHPAGNVDYRKASQFKLVYGQDYDGSTPVTQSYLVETIAFPYIGAPSKIDLAAEIGAVGGGTSVGGHLGSGFLALSWPSSYASEVIDVRLEV